MACAKPIDPASMTAPEALRHPDEPRPTELMRDLLLYAKFAEAGDALDATLARGQFLLDQARKNHAPAAEIEKLERQLEALKGAATRSQRDALQVHVGLFGRETTASQANIDTIWRAMTDDKHWAASEARANLRAIIERNGSIPEAYKPQLHKDLAVILTVAPHAAGLVTELTKRGQGKATGSPSKLGSKGNAGVGAAYELMGTAALATGIWPPANQGAPSLFIRPGEDHVVFGPKTHLNGTLDKSDKWLNPHRKTIECDIRIYREGREIGVDFKHRAEMATTYASKNLVSQAKAVGEAILRGQLAEYHFVTNGTFGESFRKAIAQANEKLVDGGLPQIGLHERVTTLPVDPSARPA